MVIKPAFPVPLLVFGGKEEALAAKLHHVQDRAPVRSPHLVVAVDNEHLVRGVDVVVIDVLCKVDDVAAELAGKLRVAGFRVGPIGQIDHK
ncbi:hypothetical protein SDC9_184002 [bioreactor metagenome]|uniref:Uncharacterized protein n=1 Tax=bioreactor metagenome TaxID=1076179 RepID=A0A645HLI7_9ZZZZ